MPTSRVTDSARTLGKIPPEVRQLVALWLRQSATEADTTASRLRVANQRHQSTQTQATVDHWAAISSACRLLAYRLETSKRGTRKPRKV